MSEVISPSTIPLPPANVAPSPPIGGWLVVIGVGLAISILQNLGTLLRVLPLTGGPIWARLTNPTSPRYHPYWRVVIIYELIAACVYVVASFIAIILFFGKRRLFPFFTIILIPTIFLAGLVDHYLAGLIPALAETAAHSRGAYVLGVKVVALHVWIPYLLVSKRVKQTFVH